MMLKWAVYKKNQETQAMMNSQSLVPDLNSNRLYNDKSRRSLDTEVVRKIKKPSRYQRRSIGATNRKNTTKKINKENINFIGNTPNYYKAGFLKNTENIALKDVSNITPTSATPLKKFEKFLFYCDEEKNVQPELPPTSAYYSGRVKKAKKIKLEMNSSKTSEVFVRKRYVYKSESRIKNKGCSLICSPKLSNKLSVNTASSKSSLRLEDYRNKNKPVCTSKTLSGGIVEIENNKDLAIFCLGPLTVKQNEIEKTTLPVFGRSIADNPLYFKKNEYVPISIRLLKRTRKNTNDFESAFNSPAINKSDAHSFVRDASFPVSLTPALKLEALRFSSMNTHATNKPDVPMSDVYQYFPKSDNLFSLSVTDEDTFAEMETKFILSKESLMSSTGSTISTTQISDTTLDRIMEDMIKSTKIVKYKRRVINNKVDTKLAVKEETPSLEALDDLFVKLENNNNVTLIKEAGYVNLSHENSVSPHNTPSKKNMSIDKLDEKQSKNSLNGSFLLNYGDGYNKRNVHTPYNVVYTETVIKSHTDIKLLNRSHSTNETCTARNNLEHNLSKSTPDVFNTTLQENNLKIIRQKGIRSKKNTNSRNSLTKQKLRETNSSESSLPRALEIGIPSPALPLQNATLCEPLSGTVQTNEPTAGINEDLHNYIPVLNNFLRSNLMSHKPMNNRNIRSKELFHLNLEKRISSSTNPAVNLKHTSNKLSKDRARMMRKLEENLIPSDAVTPVIQFKSSKRHLKYSPEESSINSKSKEKCRSIASNRLEQSDRHQPLNVTLDFEIKTKHDQSFVLQSSMCHKTSVVDGKKELELQWHLKLPLPTVV